MKKGIYLTILSAVTVACIIIGIVSRAGNMNIKFFHILCSHENISEELEEFDSINIQADGLEVYVVSGDSYSIECEEDSNSEIYWDVESGVLNITQTYYGGLFNLDAAKLTVPVPSEAALDSFSAEVGAGDISISDLTVETLNIDSDAGDITIETGAMEYGTITTDAGDISVISCAFTELTAGASVGDTEIESSQTLSNYTFDIKTDLGDVEINGEDCLGSYQKGGSGEYQISVYSSVGDIDITY